MRLATDPSQGFTLGPDAQHLVTIVPLGLRGDARAAAPFAGQLLYPDAHEASDLLIRPSATGVQTFEQLNSAAAPQSFGYRLQLTGDQTAELRDGAVAIRQGGRVVVQSAPPVVLDADHQAVPVSIRLADNVVRLDVPHRQGSFRYPIAVDPDWTSSYDYHDQPGLGLQGWHVFGQVPETPPAYYNAAVNRNWDGTEAGRARLGFVIKPIGAPGGRIIPTGAGAQLIFDAPGTTRIRSITYSHVFRYNDRDRQTLRFVLRGQNFRENNDVFQAQILSVDDVKQPSVPFADGVQTPATEAAMWMFSSPCNAEVDLNCPPSIDSDTSQTLLKVGSVEIVLTDFDFPTTQASGTLRDLQDRWTNSTDTRTISPSAVDEGSGVRDLSLSVDDTTGSHQLTSVQSPCAPNHDQPGQDSAICPRTLDLDAPFSLNTGGLLDGPSTFTVDASDLADNTASAGGSATSFSIYLDRQSPSASVSGPLYDAATRWTRPGGPSQLTVTGTDTAGGQGRTSGIAHNLLSAVDAHGATVLDRDADTCTPPGPITAPCDPGKASTFTVNPLQLPEGPITFRAASRDLAANDSPPVSWTDRFDRTPPAARATGDLLGLTSQHTNSTTPTSVTLQGRDAASGAARLQLVAANSNGDTILADRDTCTSADIDPTDGACPHNPSVDVMVDPGDLPDGPTTFIARAIDQAGIRSVDNQDWDTYVDHTPPDPPDRVNISQTSNTSVQISWPTVVDQPLGSGDVSYEYLITTGGQPIGGWRPTTSPNAQVSGLPPGVTITVEVRAKDKALNLSGVAAASHTLRVTAQDTDIDIIRKRLGLDVLESDVVAAAERITLRAAEAAAFRGLLKSLGKVASKVGVIGILADALINVADTGCGNAAIYGVAKPANVLAADVLARAARSRPGPQRLALAKLAQVRPKLTQVISTAQGLGTNGPFAAPRKVAIQEARSTITTLNAADERLHEQEIIAAYYKRNRQTDTHAYGFRSQDEARLGYRECVRTLVADACETLAAFFPGDDMPQITKHDFDAINTVNVDRRQSPLLHWIPEKGPEGAQLRAPKGWHRGNASCGPGKTGGTTGNQCDEYPFRTTLEGGPGASLRPVIAGQNRLQGEHLNRFYGLCNLRGPKNAFLVVPLPPQLRMSTRYACNPP